MTKNPSTMDFMERLAFDDDFVVPTGEVTVQLRDERGKLKHEEKKANFISKVWKAHARGMMRLQWMGFGYNLQGGLGPSTYSTTGAPAVTWPYGVGTVPQLPIHAIGCWNDTSAEDAVNEHMIKMPANSTGMVAWASRHPVGNPTGARGVVNTTESFVDIDKVRFVFDWISSQGNGTFQSVGWFKPGAPGIPVIPYGVAHRGTIQTASVTPGSILTSATGLYIKGGWIDPATGKWYFAVSGTPAANNLRILSVPAATVMDDSLASIVGTSISSNLAISTESDQFAPTTGFASTNLLGQIIGQDTSGNRILIYPTSTTSFRWAKVPSTGAVTSYTLPNPTTNSTNSMSGAVIGTTAYFSSFQDSNIYTYSTVTGAAIATLAIDAQITALATLASMPSGARVWGMCTDGTSLYVEYGPGSGGASGNHLVVKLDTSGVLLEIIGIIPTYTNGSWPTDTGAAPYAGTYSYAPNAWESSGPAYLLTQDQASAGTTIENTIGVASLGDTQAWANVLSSGGDLYRQLQFYDGALYVIGAVGGFGNSNVTQFGWSFARLGYNLGSRVKLASPLVKASTDTLKITYDITLPGWF